MPGVTYRPVGARIVAYGSAVALVVMTIVIGVALPSDIEFTVAELITLAVTLGAMLAALHGIGRSYVRADDAGLEILNGYRLHHVPWERIKGISMNSGAPWPTLVLHDDERILMFAIQGTDGAAARAAVDDLVRRIDE